MLPCHGECNIPEGYLEKQSQFIDRLRQDFVERIQHRARLLVGVEMTAEACEAMFETQILDSGMEFVEAQQVLSQMHNTNMRMQREHQA